MSLEKEKLSNCKGEDGNEHIRQPRKEEPLLLSCLAGAGGGVTPSGVRGQTPAVHHGCGLALQCELPRAFYEGPQDLVKNVFNSSFVK